MQTEKNKQKLDVVDPSAAKYFNIQAESFKDQGTSVIVYVLSGWIDSCTLCQWSLVIFLEISAHSCAAPIVSDSA